MTGFQHSTPKSFYVYIHRRKTDGSVFYVGKGSGDRAWNQWARSKYWRNIVAKHGHIVEIVQDGMQEWWAFELERDLIAYYGRDTLCNLTDGGDGTSGLVHSEETKKRLSEVNKNKVLTIEQRMAMSAARKGKPNGHLGLKRTPEARANMSAAQKRVKNRVDISGDNNPSRREDVRQRMKQPRPKMRGSGNPYATAVMCVETGVVFGSIVEAKDWLQSIGRSGCVKQCARGDSKTAGGYRWEYVKK